MLLHLFVKKWIKTTWNGVLQLLSCYIFLVPIFVFKFKPVSVHNWSMSSNQPSVSGDYPLKGSRLGARGFHILIIYVSTAQHTLPFYIFIYFLQAHSLYKIALLSYFLFCHVIFPHFPQFRSQYVFLRCPSLLFC